jgi:hypothetical protein
MYDLSKSVKPPKSMKPRSNQHAFDMALQGIRSQGYVASISEITESFAYRGNDECRCGVGWMISDSNYKEDFEGETAGGLIYKQFLDKYFDKVNLDLLMAIQFAHDGCLRQSTESSTAIQTGARVFEQRMKEIAEDYRLRYTPV